MYTYIAVIREISSRMKFCCFCCFGPLLVIHIYIYMYIYILDPLQGGASPRARECGASLRARECASPREPSSSRVRLSNIFASVRTRRSNERPVPGCKDEPWGNQALN